MNGRATPEPMDVDALAAAVARRVLEELKYEPDGPRRLALSVTEACQSLGCSWDFWKAHVAPELRLVRRGSRRLVPVTELQRWLAENAEHTLDRSQPERGSARTRQAA